MRGTQPRVVVEQLVPALEPGAQLEGTLDNSGDASVSAREQPFDLTGLALVIAQVQVAVAGNAPADEAELALDLLRRVLRRPLEGRVRFRNESTHRHGDFVLT